MRYAIIPQWMNTMSITYFYNNRSNWAQRFIKSTHTNYQKQLSIYILQYIFGWKSAARKQDREKQATTYELPWFTSCILWCPDFSPPPPLPAPSLPQPRMALKTIGIIIIWMITVSINESQKACDESDPQPLRLCLYYWWYYKSPFKMVDVISDLQLIWRTDIPLSYKRTHPIIHYIHCIRCSPPRLPLLLQLLLRIPVPLHLRPILLPLPPLLGRLIPNGHCRNTDRTMRFCHNHHYKQ